MKRVERNMSVKEKQGDKGSPGTRTLDRTAELLGMPSVVREEVHCLLHLLVTPETGPGRWPTNASVSKC